MSDNKVLKFGGNGGSMISIEADDINGRSVELWGGKTLDSLRIKQTDGKWIIHGGDGGYKQTVFDWPKDGIIELQTLYGATYEDSYVVSYCKFRSGGTVQEWGDEKNNTFELDCDLMVKLTGITTGKAVDALTFEVVNLSEK